MGSAANITFTSPVGGCLVQATASFEASVSGSGSTDFGSSDGYQIVMTEYLSDGVTYVNSEGSTNKRMALARAKYGDIYSSTYRVPAGNVVSVDIALHSGTSHTITAWGIDLRVEVIRR